MINKSYLRFLPNFLTSLRIALTPICIYLLISNPDFRHLALFLFIIASLTDFFDGYFARKYQTVSKIGSFLDPLADKFLVVGVFVSFFILREIIDIYILLMIVFRDVFVTILRILMQSKGKVMVTSKLSKYKTTIQIMIIIILFLNPYFYTLNQNVLYYLALSMSILTFYTGLHYLVSNFKQLKILLAHED